MVERVGAGAPLLGNALPARREPFGAEPTRAYVEGLLPEGPRRARIGRELGIDAADGYQLLAELGRDCPGAVVFVPAGERVVPRPPAELAWLDEGELEELVRAPPPAYFDPRCEHRMRATLPGLRHKLSLVRDERRGWAWPEAGVPSTHVVKPETGEYPEYVANEMFCTSVARRIGLPVVEAAVAEVGGRPCLVSPRYDRVGEGLAAQRLHCESFVQALGISPGAEEGSPEAEAPSFGEARGLIQAVGRGEDVAALLTIALCNYVLGNGDAHGRNLALLDPGRRSLDGEAGTQRIAPLTDLTSTAVYEDPLNVGMTLVDDYREGVYLLELAESCEECELEFDVLRGLAALTAARMGVAIEATREQAERQGWHRPIVDRIAELASERAFGLGAEVEY